MFFKKKYIGLLFNNNIFQILLIILFKYIYTFILSILN